jgi:hypothetical protein
MTGSLLPRIGDAFASYFSRSDLMVHTLWLHGSIVGFCITGLDSPLSCFVYELQMAHHRSGFGQQLLQYVEKSQSPGTMIVLHTHADNREAQLFYFAMAYVMTGVMSGESMLIFQNKVCNRVRRVAEYLSNQPSEHYSDSVE